VHRSIGRARRIGVASSFKNALACWVVLVDRVFGILVLLQYVQVCSLRVRLVLQTQWPLAYACGESLTAALENAAKTGSANGPAAAMRSAVVGRSRKGNFDSERSATAKIGSALL
jgi:hypothetical protein